MLTFGSLFAGIGGFDLGLERAGLRCAWQVEIDPYCLKVLEKHWPDVPRYKDVRDAGRHNLPPVDLICGGFPCQDVSVAGNRAGLAGKRSGLWFEFHRIVAELKPAWVVVENVPGLLSSNGGRDFAAILRGLVECGYGVCWRVLDAQYFGVPQRRRRVFIVGHLGDGCVAEVLFECEGGTGDTAPSREAGTSPAYAITERAGGHRLQREDNYAIGTLAASGAGLNRAAGQENELDFLIPFDYCGQGSERTFIHRKEGKAQMIAGRPDAIAWHENKANELTPSNIAKAIRAGASHSYQGVGVRRLTPTECERLQGFPDGWTEGHSDSARYRMLGNAVCVPVAEWLGRQIAALPGL